MTVQWETDLPAIVRASHGLEVVLGDLGTVHKVRSEITEGRMVVIEHSLPPSRLAAPLHRHSREDEISYVLAGQMGAILGDRVVQARAGSYVVKPRGQWHTYWNAGECELRLMELLVPGGFEGCLERLAEAMAARVPVEVSTLERIGAEYGVEFDFAGVSDLCQHFGVTLARWPQRRARRRAGEKHGQHDSVRYARE
jgi:quercetin dioxygenase-like cupin family protein